MPQTNGCLLFIIKGIPTVLTVSGCQCVNAGSGGSIKWSSPDAELTFNPSIGSSTEVTASSAGNYTIEVECVGGTS